MVNINFVLIFKKTFVNFVLLEANFLSFRNFRIIRVRKGKYQ